MQMIDGYSECPNCPSRMIRPGATCRGCGGATAAVAAPSDTQAPEVAKSQSRFDARSEKELQEQVESWLSLRGYRRMTADNAANPGQLGWFGHYQKAIGNPLTPDLLILSPAMDRCLCVELKKPEGTPHYSPGQREMIEAGRWHLCRSLDAVREVVEVWDRR